MKKMLLVIFILLALGVGAALFLSLGPQPPPKRGVETTFLEFTNTPSGPRARFAVTYGPRFRGWSWRESVTSHRRADGVWEDWAEADNSKTYGFIDNQSPFPRTRDGKKIHSVLEQPVGNTNTAWRIVLKVDESPPRPPWPIMMAQQVKWMVRKQTPRLGPGQRYFLTNETTKIN